MHKIKIPLTIVALLSFASQPAFGKQCSTETQRAILNAMSLFSMRLLPLAAALLLAGFLSASAQHDARNHQWWGEDSRNAFFGEFLQAEG